MLARFQERISEHCLLTGADIFIEYARLRDLTIVPGPEGNYIGCGFHGTHQHCDPTRPGPLLRARREQPSGRRAAEHRDELASS